MNNDNLTKKQRRELRKQEKRQEQAQREKKSRLRRLFLWGGMIAGLIGIITLLTMNANTNPVAPTENGDTLPPHLSITEADHTKGSPASGIALIEYSDFQCPACASYHPLMQRLTEELDDKLYFAYRHFPLPQHKNASPAAEAAEAAGVQGKFWEMHDLLFENQSAWASLSSKQAQETFTQYAEKLELNIEQFQQAFKSSTVKETVQKQYKGGLTTARVNATPTFFLNGKKISAPPNYEAFKKLILETP